MTGKLVVFDIDGTLITDEHTILPRTIKAIEDLKEAGHEVMCATGRSLLLAKEMLEEAGLENAILNNGSVAFIEGKQVYSTPLDKEAIRRLAKISDENNLDMIYNSLNASKIRSDAHLPETKIAMESFGSCVPEVEKDYFENEDIYQIVATVREDQMSILEGKFPEFRFVRWHEFGIDVLPNNGSKAETIKHISKIIGIKQEDIIAFGDGQNDIEMLQYVGTGVAMGNAKDNVKEVSDMVTETNNDDGIYHALHKLGLIK